MKAKGFCMRHYRRWMRYGDPLAGGRQRAPKGKPERFNHIVLDKLICDGGWMTLDALEMELDRGRDSIDRALFRLKEKGLVDRRYRTERAQGGGISEWKAC
jgi:hypothetical protein